MSNSKRPADEIPLYLEFHPDYAKARLLWRLNPNHYRFAARIGRFPEPLRRIAMEVLVTDDHQIALVKNSKAGCTSAAHLIHQISKGVPCRTDVHRPDIGLIQGPEHFETALAVLQAADTFRLTTVRHPVTRAMSAFSDFFLARRNHLSPLHTEAIRRFGFSDDASAARNFDAFLSLVEYSFGVDRPYTDRHFRPQVINTAWGHLSFDAVARTETLGPDLARAVEAAGLPASAYAAFDFSARNQSGRSAFRPDKGQLRRLEQLYHDDFEAFGYQPGDY